MKHYALLVFSTLLAATAVSCSKEETTSKDAGLAGVNVAVGETSGYTKLFVLNEGQMGTNNASLDFFRFSDGNYVRNSFALMNPEQVLGLGDIGNDIEMYKNKLWLVINGSGLVEVVDPEDETHVATIKVPSPRQIAFKSNYAYVTSYSGAYYGGPDRLGSVYKISTKSYNVVDSLQVGYQPEGIAEKDGKLYVANSGGLKSDYSYDNRISVVDIASFSVEKEITVTVNLQSVVVNGNSLYVSTLGNYYDVSSGIWEVDLSTGSASQSSALSDVRSGGKMCLCNDVIYTFNNAYGPTYSVDANNLYAYDTTTDEVKTYTLESTVKVAYGVCANEENGDIYIGDANDYVNPGSVHCFDKNLNYKWSATAGVDPGHLLLW